MEDWTVFGVAGALAVKRLVNALKNAGLPSKYALLAAFGVAALLIAANLWAETAPAFALWYERVWNVLFYALVASEIYDTQQGLGAEGYKWY